MGCCGSSPVVVSEALGLKERPRTVPVTVWRPSLSAPYPEAFLVSSNKTKDLAVAFSGGGMRSAVLCLGWMQALEEMGISITRDVRYVSTISGSTWTLAPMLYRPSNEGPGVFLGDGCEPEFLTLEKCDELCAGGHSRVLTESNFIANLAQEGLTNVPLSGLGLTKAGDGVDYWSAAVGTSFFVPNGILCHLNSSTPAVDSGKAAQCAHALDGLATEIYPARASSVPFLIMNASILVGGAQGCVPLEFTPMYSGTPVAFQNLDSVFVEPEGFCATSVAKADLPQTKGSISVTVSRVVSIHEMSGISSSNLAQTRGDEMTAEAYEKANFPCIQCFSNGLQRLVDGGSTDNTGIIALLRRGCRNVLAGLACNLSVALDSVVDANIHSLGTLAGLFGRQKSELGEVDSVKDDDFNRQRVVFPADKWEELLAGLRSRLQAGQGLVHKLALPVLPNAQIGVAGGYTLQLVITISGECSSFVARLPEAVRSQIKADAEAASQGGSGVGGRLQAVGLLESDLSIFPYPPVGHLKYSPALLGLMSQQARWTLLQSKGDVLSLVA